MPFYLWLLLRGHHRGTLSYDAGEQLLAFNPLGTDSLRLDHTYSVIAQNETQQHLDMCATKVQHSPSASISVTPSTHTV